MNLSRIAHPGVHLVGVTPSGFGDFSVSSTKFVDGEGVENQVVYYSVLEKALIIDKRKNNMSGLSTFFLFRVRHLHRRTRIYFLNHWL